MASIDPGPHAILVSATSVTVRRPSGAAAWRAAPRLQSARTSARPSALKAIVYRSVLPDGAPPLAGGIHRHTPPTSAGSAPAGMAGGIMIGVTGGRSLLRCVPPAHAATAAASTNASASDASLMRRLYRSDTRLTYTARTARIAMALDPDRILARCDALAAHSEQPDGLTRVFLSPEQRAVND